MRTRSSQFEKKLKRKKNILTFVAFNMANVTFVTADVNPESNDSTTVFPDNNVTSNLADTEGPSVYYGPSHPYFMHVHCTALTALFVSTFFSLSTIAYQIRSNTGNFFRWKIGKYYFYYFRVCFLYMTY